MNHSNAAYSNLSNDQIADLQALETKFNSSNKQGETILIAYKNPK